MIKVGLVTIDVSSIGIKFKNFLQVGLHLGRTLYCQKPIIRPKLVLFFGTFLELSVLPSIICVVGMYFQPIVDFKICNQLVRKR